MKEAAGTSGSLQQQSNLVAREAAKSVLEAFGLAVDLHRFDTSAQGEFSQNILFQLASAETDSESAQLINNVKLQNLGHVEAAARMDVALIYERKIALVTTQANSRISELRRRATYEKEQLQLRREEKEEVWHARQSARAQTLREFEEECWNRISTVSVRLQLHEAHKGCSQALVEKKEATLKLLRDALENCREGTHAALQVYSCWINTHPYSPHFEGALSELHQAMTLLGDVNQLYC
jgi:hypothetical protein